MAFSSIRRARMNKEQKVPRLWKRSVDRAERLPLEGHPRAPRLGEMGSGFPK